MFISKLISTTLDIEDPIGIYTDIENNLINLLQNNFGYKCYRACYISKIVRIKKYSDCEIIGLEKPKGRINVQFQVEAEVYEPDEILVGVVVTENRNGVIWGETPTANVCMSADNKIKFPDDRLQRYLNSIKAGQTIPVRVRKSKYRIGYGKIAIDSVPFMQNIISPVYKIEAFKYDTAIFDPIIEEIEQLENSLTPNHDKKKLEFFENLLYPYTAKKAPPRATADIIEMIKKFDTPAIITVNSAILRERKVEIGGESPITKYTPQEICLNILSQYRNYLSTVKTMAAIYSTDEMIKQHQNVWALLIQNKAN